MNSVIKSIAGIMENDAKQQKQENVRTLFAGCDSLLTGYSCYYYQKELSQG